MKTDAIYHSASKGEVRISEMNLPWLMNSWRRLSDTGEQIEARDAMHAELIARGCTLDPETGRWELPPKDEA